MTLDIDPSFITSTGVYEMPIPPDRSVFLRAYMLGPGEEPLIVPHYTTETYRWDGTVTETGERRMRWQP